MSKIAKLILVFVSLFGLVSVAALQFAPTAFAGPTSTEAAKRSSCEGIGGQYQADGSCKTDSPSLNNIIARIINIFSGIIGVVAVIMIMVGGFKYITANGDSGSISSAKTTIVYAVVGLIIVAFAQFIVQFVINETTATPPPPAETTLRQRIDLA